MEQHGQRNDAAVKDVQIMLNEDEYALSTEQRQRTQRQSNAQKCTRIDLLLQHCHFF